MLIRDAQPDDDDAVVHLLASSLGWVPDDQHRRFLEWKHRENPFGSSPAWVAVDGDRVIGYRALLRWEFERAGGHRIRAVRAVDTATDPQYRGQGVFNRLTMHAIDACARDGVEFVFNTPNDSSRPGYEKMGWQVVGRLPARVRLRGPHVVARLLRARVPADLWSVPTTAGSAPTSVFTEDRSLDALCSSSDPTPGVMRTRRSIPYLRWRYGFAPLGYRVVMPAETPEEGFAVFRLRRRGGALEAVLCELLVPSGRARLSRHLTREILRQTRADYVIRLGGSRFERGWVTLPSSGPILTWRPLTVDAPTIGKREWALTLGDIELL